MTVTDTVHADDTDNLSLAEAIKDDDIDAVMAFLKKQGAWTQDALYLEVNRDGDDPYDALCDEFTMIASVDSCSESGINISQTVHFECRLGELETSEFGGRYDETWEIDGIRIDQDSDIHGYLQHDLGRLRGFDRFVPPSLDLKDVCDHIGSSSGFFRNHLAWRRGVSREIVDEVCEGGCSYDTAFALLDEPDREYFVIVLDDAFEASGRESLEWGQFGSISADDDAGDIFDERKDAPFSVKLRA